MLAYFELRQNTSALVGDPDCESYSMGDLDSQVGYLGKSKYLSWIWVMWVLISTHKYPQQLVQIYLTCDSKWWQKLLHYDTTISDISEGRDNMLLSFGCLPLSLKTSIISSRGTAPARSHHAPSTDTAQVLSDESECCIFKTVNLPWEKACSTSVDVAVNQV